MLIIIKTAFIRIKSVTSAIKRATSVNTANLLVRRLVKKVMIRTIRRTLF